MCLFLFNQRAYCHQLQAQNKLFVKLQECLDQKMFKQYSATTSHDRVIGVDKMFYKDEMIVQFLIKLASKKRNVFEEILILDEIGLVGSLGGSLGLFVGFSFFGYATPILEAVFNKVADLLVRYRLVGQARL